MKNFIVQYCELPVAVRRPLWQMWHNMITWFDKGGEITFLNYGYDHPVPHKETRLTREDEGNRYCIQLYDYVVREADLAGKDVLEVGCGRGGGASYIKRYLRPQTYVGMDISEKVIRFCRGYHKISGLSFIKGYAERQPFSSDSFDAVVNVESARCYRDLAKFFSETARVLKPDGYFLFADMIRKGEVAHIEYLLCKAGFEIEGKQNIGAHVVRALDKDHDRRVKAIHTAVPGFLRSAFLEFAGAKGTRRYREFASGEMEYWTYTLINRSKKGAGAVEYGKVAG